MLTHLHGNCPYVQYLAFCWRHVVQLVWVWILRHLVHFSNLACVGGLSLCQQSIYLNIRLWNVWPHRRYNFILHLFTCLFTGVATTAQMLVYSYWLKCIVFTAITQCCLWQTSQHGPHANQLKPDGFLCPSHPRQSLNTQCIHPHTSFMRVTVNQRQSAIHFTRVIKLKI